MIDIKCYHSLELPFEEFPAELPAVPRVGDFIGSITHVEGVCVELVVRRVRWLQDGFDWIACIELDVPSSFDSHAEFYQHYNALFASAVASFSKEGGEHAKS